MDNCTAHYPFSIIHLPARFESSSKVLRISGKTKILDLLTMYPNAADVLAAYNLHCFSCPFGAGETIEDGCAAHGFSPELTAELIDDLRHSMKVSRDIPKKKK
jgi:hybrid cluster-associated redox disulfide protein